MQTPCLPVIWDVYMVTQAKLERQLNMLI